MTKKIFSAMFVAVGMLFATSCANEEITSSQAGNEVTVSFSLGLEGGIDTRAISDGTGADKLEYAVFNAAGERITTIAKVSKTGVTFPTTENITLAKGQTYKIAFWAQDADCDAYTVEDDMKVAIDYADVNNDETRDAFFKSIEFTVTGSTSIDVVLKRPFAQINVGVYESDWNAAVASGIEIANSVAYIKNAATSINLLNGKVGEETTDVPVEYKAAAIPTESLMVDVDKDGTKEAYKWLSMSYILVADHGTTPNNDGIYGAAATTLNDLGFSFVPVSGNAITFAQGLKSVPVERNWRTNIIGKILTGDVEFNISIDPIYDGDYIYPDGAMQELAAVLAMGGVFNATGPIEMEGEQLYAQADAILNFNGNKVVAGSATAYGIVADGEGIDLVINDADIDSKGDGVGAANGANVVFNGDKLAVNSGSTSGRYLFYLEGAGSTITINEGEFSFSSTLNQKRAYIYAGAGTTAYVKGGTFGKASTRSGYTAGILGEGTVIITGGTFGFDPSAWVAPGYKAIKDGSKYVVVPETTAAIVSDAAALQTSIANINNGETIVLKEGTYTDIITLEGGKTYNIVANGNVVLPGVAHETNSLTSASTVTFEGVTFDNSLQTTGWYTGTSPNIMPCVGIWGGHLTFKNCTFKVEGTSKKETGVMTWWTGDNKATLNFEGCKFEGINDHANARAMQIYGKVDMTVKNCTFTTYKDYTLKYVGSEGCVAEFEGNNVSNSDNFVELGSSTYPGKNYTAKFVNNTLNGSTKLWVVANEEGQKVFENGTQKK